VHYFRSASLRGFRTVVAEAGGDADVLVAGVGLAPDILDQDDLLVDGVRSAALLEIAAERLACPDLGLRMARQQSLSVLGALSIALASSPTLGATLPIVNRYLFVHSSFASFELGPDPAGVAGTSALYYRPARPTGPVQPVDLSLGFIHRGISFLNGGDYALREVWLPYNAPGRPELYEEFYGAPVVLGSPVSDAAVLRIPNELPARPLAGRDEPMHQLAIAFLDRMSSRGESDLLLRTREVVRHTLGAGTADQAAVAHLLHLHPRTLQRRMESHGVTFREVVDDVRRERALHLLATTTLPLGYVAGMCGFAEQASFSRAARRWWGCSPTAMRRRPDDRAR
jgi:AraC-like DNA-binding protein